MTGLDNRIDDCSKMASEKAYNRNNPLIQIQMLDNGKDRLLHSSPTTQFYQALRNDNVLAYERIKSQVPQFSEFVNTELQYEDNPLISSSREPESEFHLPLHICVASAGTECFPLIIRDGADITQCDVRACNVLHTLIIACSIDREREECYVSLLEKILEVLNYEKLQLLSKQTNRDGYRPLELSVRLGTFGLFRSLLNHPGMIVETNLDAGVNRYALYNVSEYENFHDRNRALRSPLRLLIYLTQDSVSSFHKYHIYRLPVLKRWMLYKVVRNLPFLLVWLACRLAFFSILAMIDPSTTLSVLFCHRTVPENRTEYGNQLCEHNVRTREELMETSKYLRYSYVWGIMILAVDGLEMILIVLDKQRRRAYSGMYFPKSDFVAYTRFYRMCQFILVSLCVLSIPVSEYLRYDTIKLIHAAYTFKAIYLPLMVMSLMFILEMFPIFGLFAITLQQMITSMLVFTIFIGIVKVLFAQFMTAVAKQHGFSDIGTSIYQLFKIEMGASPFPDRPEPVFMIIHVIYYFISAILLLNYLIAVMSSLATNTAEDRKAVQMLRRLDVVFTAEERYGQWFWRLYYYFTGPPRIRLDAKI